jgi:signal transduction histidine kinase
MDTSRKQWFRLIPIRILLPVALTVALFVGTIFLLILPRMESRMMADKRDMIRELTQTAWSSLYVYLEKERRGEISRADAQARAIESLRRLRYGPEGKDYFWINDMHPHLLMHPYRPDLEGTDISNFADPNGKKLFVEFVETVRAHGAGYVDYQWQWKDDPVRIVPKISYVKGFDPWGWIVGTGIYVEDVRAEIAAITRNLTVVCLVILVLIMGLSGYVIAQSIGGERRRQAADRQAQLHREQLFQADKMATLGTLVSGVAHEINNPTTFVMMNAPILQKVWDSVLPILDEHHRRHPDFKVARMDYDRIRERIPVLLQDIVDGAARVKTIVGDLKDFARREPAQMSDTFSVNDAAQKAVGLVNNLIRKRTHHFSMHLGTDVPEILGNRQKIEQVIINLLVNACQALTEPEQSVTLSTRIDPAAGFVVIEIQDQGCGISEALCQRIKDPFFTTKRESGGTGLGLAIADRIIEDHGGKMVFSSVENEGTLVRVTLPCREKNKTEKLDGERL